MTADPRLEDVMARLIDGVYRLNGRLVAAAKMTTAVAGLRPPHWIVLTAIARAAEPPTVPRIARALGQTRQGVQRVADELAAQGLVAWTDNPDHARAKRLVLSALGRQAFELANREGEDWMRRISVGLDIAALQQVSTVLEELRRRLDRDARSP